MSVIQTSENAFRWLGKIKGWHVLGLMVGGLIIGSPPWFIVEPSEMAGIRRLGKVITQAPLSEGLHFKAPFLDEADIMQVSLTAFQVDDLPIFTVDNQWINVSVGISFTVPEISVFKLLYQVGRSGNFDIDRNLRPVISESTTLVFSRHPAEKLTQEREQIVKELETELAAALQRVFGLAIEDVQIANIHYLSERAAVLCEQLKQLENPGNPAPKQ